MDADAVIAQAAIAVAQRRAGVGREQTSNGCAFAIGDVEWQELPVRGEALLDGCERRTGADSECEVTRIVMVEGDEVRGFEQDLGALRRIADVLLRSTAGDGDGEAA